MTTSKAGRVEHKYATFVEAEIILALTADDEEQAVAVAKTMLPGERDRFLHTTRLIEGVVRRANSELIAEQLGEDE